eukprot:5446657-Alexandrium_andersonii.AAC.1
MGLALAMAFHPEQPFWGDHGPGPPPGQHARAGVSLVHPRPDALAALQQVPPCVDRSWSTRHVVALVRGEMPFEWPQLPPAVAGEPPARPNAFADGSLKFPRSTCLQRSPKALVDRVGGGGSPRHGEEQRKCSTSLDTFGDSSPQSWRTFALTHAALADSHPSSRLAFRAQPKRGAANATRAPRRQRAH